MFYYLSGIIAELLPNMAVMDCSGVGYACRTTTHTLNCLEKGKPGKLYTWLNVGDGVFELYGFAARSELISFQQLISVSGVGPKAALAILSINTPESLAMAVMTEDVKSLTAAAGVGKKIAQRIILELKDKLSQESVSGSSDVSISSTAPTSEIRNKASEAAQALSVLGYSSQEVSIALKGLDMEKLSLEEIIRQGLRRMAQ